MQLQKEKTEIKKEVKVIAKVGSKIVDTPVRIYDHISGDRFSHSHKMFCGSLLMTIGVFISTIGGETSYRVIKFICDGFGYALHGAGCAPFMDFLHYVLIRRGKILASNEKLCEDEKEDASKTNVG
jgi:hypothetical protein